jgi:hypothetical protein
MIIVKDISINSPTAKYPEQIKLHDMNVMKSIEDFNISASSKRLHA